MINYTYTKTIIPDVLQSEIFAAGLIDIQYIDTVANGVFIYFNGELSEEQQILLDFTVEKHVGPPLIAIHDVTPRQMRQALVLSGVSVQQIEDALDSLDEPMRSLARIEWEYSTAFQRHRPLVQQVGIMLGWTSTQLDNLWILAGSLD